MQINDITTYLYTHQLENLAKKAIDSKSSEDVSEFAEMLTKEITNISEGNQLANALSGSVLSGLGDSKTIADLSEDLLNSGSGREVISKLAEGHLNSIVLTDNQKDDSEPSIKNQMNANQTNDTQALANAINQIAEILNTANQK